MSVFKVTGSISTKFKVTGTIVNKFNVKTSTPDKFNVSMNPAPAFKVAINQGIPGPAGTSGLKAGLVDGSSFTGNPKEYQVLFSEPFPDLNYVINITGTDSRDFSYDKSTKTINGFKINAHANANLSGEVSWTAQPVGER